MHKKSSGNRNADIAMSQTLRAAVPKVTDLTCSDILIIVCVCVCVCVRVCVCLGSLYTPH